jgi:hypothetical protein
VAIDRKKKEKRKKTKKRKRRENVRRRKIRKEGKISTKHAKKTFDACFFAGSSKQKSTHCCFCGLLKVFDLLCKNVV